RKRGGGRGGGGLRAPPPPACTGVDSARLGRALRKPARRPLHDRQSAGTARFPAQRSVGRLFRGAAADQGVKCFVERLRRARLIGATPLRSATAPIGCIRLTYCLPSPRCPRTSFSAVSRRSRGRSRMRGSPAA